MFPFSKTVSPQIVIESATDEMPSRLGAALQSLILHGIHAQGATDASDSDAINLLVVLHQIDTETMSRLALAYQSIRGFKQISPMVLTEAELQSSTDVFPVTFLEMKRHHRLLWGVDVLSDLTIEPTHLRLRCEQELKNLLLRMQSSFLLNHQAPRRLYTALKQNYFSFARTMAASLLLIDEATPDSLDESVDLAAERFELSGDTIELVHQAVSGHRGNVQVNQDAIRSLYSSFMQVVGEATGVIDQLPETDSLVEVTELSEDAS